MSSTFIKDDFEPIQHDFPTPDDIHIYIIGDVHLGSADFEEKRFRDYVKRILDDPDGYCVLVGDLIDNGIKSSKTSVYEETMPPCDQIEAISVLLKPLADAGRILGTVEGNHERRTRSESGTDTGLQIADNLGIRPLYRRRVAILQIKLNTNKHSKEQVYYIVLMHGGGTGTSIKKEMDYINAYEGADILITGHTHKPKVVPSIVKRISRQKCKIEDVQKLCITCSSWLKYGGYGVEKMYTPTPSCVEQTLVLCGTKKGVKVVT